MYAYNKYTVNMNQRRRTHYKKNWSEMVFDCQPPVEVDTYSQTKPVIYSNTSVGSLSARDGLEILKIDVVLF
ncbi:hypothetical protein CRE_22422 [Caenorhabditis remanei]|uniref:Uncharacterized protein n=1 Tax=Caenorhabditis remanei TaxID=31234 RepID=E3ME35_CAERE|nr:hypothetical protein CRE_22422 [Caenorhabditis remanei]